MAEYYWSGNRNAGQRGISSENYAAGMPNSSYDWGVTSNWLVKDYSSPNNDVGWSGPITSHERMFVWWY